MKKNYLFLSLLSVISVTLFFSCEEAEIPTFSGIQTIGFGQNGNNLESFTFSSFPSNIVEWDVGKYTVKAVGFISEKDRPFVIKQKELEGVNNAIEGVHYKFYREEHFIAANRTSRDVKVTALRENLDPNTIYTLYFELEGTSDFSLISDSSLWGKTVIIGDVLLQPEAWDRVVTRGTLGPWSKNKHRWMIDQTGQTWNSGFIRVMIHTGDQVYWREELNRLLKEYNEEVGPLYDDNGVEIISFP